MKTEKAYIVLTEYMTGDTYIGMSIHKTIEEALEETKKELSAALVKSVKIYETDQMKNFFFGKWISYHEK